MLERARLGVFCAVLASAFGAWLLPGIANADFVSNGGFETGNFSGWTQEAQTGSAGAWYVYTGTTSPLNPALTIPAPPQGKYAAISDETQESSSVLYQDITLPAGGRYTLSMYVYYTSGDPMNSPASLDYTTTDNQQYRIDIMSPNAPLTSVAPADILKNVFATQTGSPETMAPTLITVDVSQFAGQTIRLRIAQVDNEDVLNAGADAVSITAPPLVTTGAATGVGLTGATLDGTANPLTQATSVHFQYGTTTAYGSTTTPQTAGSGETSQTVSAAISGLYPGTTYHYRLVASNSAGTTAGPDMTLITSPTAKVLGARESHHKFRESNKRARIARKLAPIGTTFRFKLNTAARVVLTFTHKGHKRGTLTFAGRAGTNSVHFYGRTSSSKLKPGTYTVVIRVRTPGFASSSRRLKFRIVN